MSDIVKGVLGGAWTLVVGWILPSAVVIALFGIFVLPSLHNVPLLKDVATASSASRALILLVSSVLVGWVLAAIQNLLYRMLEGYVLWPNRFREKRICYHQKRRADLEKKASTKPDDRQGTPGLSQALLLERFFRYPDSKQQVAPTMLGNAIRRLEYYGQDRYSLDSQRLWYQLSAVAPGSLAKEVDNARAGVDFFVCLLYTLGALAATSVLALAVNRSDWLRLSLTGLLATGAVVGCYRAAVFATDTWSAAVRALVDLGRLPLAAAYGLLVPDELEEERKMWRALGWLLNFPYNEEAAKQLNPYRRTAPVDHCSESAVALINPPIRARRRPWMLRMRLPISLHWQACI